jgi:hypothetical protein
MTERIADQAAPPRSLSRYLHSLSAPRNCIGCGRLMPAGWRRARPCADCRERFAIHDPGLEVDAWVALQVVVLAPLIAGSLLLLLFALAVLPHLLMVSLGLGPAALLTYFGVFALGARIGRWMEDHGLR